MAEVCLRWTSSGRGSGPWLWSLTCRNIRSLGDPRWESRTGCQKASTCDLNPPEWPEEPVTLLKLVWQNRHWIPLSVNRIIWLLVGFNMAQCWRDLLCWEVQAVPKLWCRFGRERVCHSLFVWRNECEGCNPHWAWTLLRVQWDSRASRAEAVNKVMAVVKLQKLYLQIRG